MGLSALPGGRGVYGYADSHNNKIWQLYAATTGAACMKAKALLVFKFHSLDSIRTSAHYEPVRLHLTGRLGTTSDRDRSATNQIPNAKHSAGCTFGESILKKMSQFPRISSSNHYFLGDKASSFL